MFSQEEKSQVAYHLGAVSALVKFANEYYANDPARRDRLLLSMTPAHQDLALTDLEVARAAQK